MARLRPDSSFSASPKLATIKTVCGGSALLVVLSLTLAACQGEEGAPCVPCST